MYFFFEKSWKMEKLEIGVIFASDLNGAFFQTFINESEISTKLCVFWYPYCSVENTLKVLSSEMDPAENRLIRLDFFKGIVASVF